MLVWLPEPVSTRQKLEDLGFISPCQGVLLPVIPISAEYVLLPPQPNGAFLEPPEQIVNTPEYDVSMVSNILYAINKTYPTFINSIILEYKEKPAQEWPTLPSSVTLEPEEDNIKESPSVNYVIYG